MWGRGECRPTPLLPQAHMGTLLGKMSSCCVSVIAEGDCLVPGLVLDFIQYQSFNPLNIVLLLRGV